MDAGAFFLLKLALISDVHGNLVALEGVLHDLEKESSLDEIISLGDVSATGPKPHEALVALREKNPLCIMGNTDDWLLNPPPKVGEKAQSNEQRIIQDVDLWCSKQLTDSDKEYIGKNFKPTLHIPLGEDNMSLLAFHGSPSSYHEWISPSFSDEVIDKILSGNSATVMAGGHSHRQMLRRFRETILINPGSVGIPFERERVTGKLRIPPWSEYAIITSEGKSLDVSFRRVPVDFDAVTKSIVESGMPHKDIFLDSWMHHIENILVSSRLT